MQPDHLNALFELIGGVAIFLNVAAVLKDKSVAGVRWWTVSFFAAWGLWNLYYYPHLEQWWSFAAGLFMVTANILWVALLIHYCRKKP